MPDIRSVTIVTTDNVNDYGSMAESRRPLLLLSHLLGSGI